MIWKGLGQGEWPRREAAWEWTWREAWVSLSAWTGLWVSICAGRKWGRAWEKVALWAAGLGRQSLLGEQGLWGDRVSGRQGVGRQALGKVCPPLGRRAFLGLDSRHLSSQDRIMRVCRPAWEDPRILG